MTTEKQYEVVVDTLHSTQDYKPYMIKRIEEGWEYTHKMVDVKLPHGGYVDQYYYRKRINLDK